MPLTESVWLAGSEICDGVRVMSFFVELVARFFCGAGGAVFVLCGRWGVIRYMYSLDYTIPLLYVRPVGRWPTCPYA